MSPSRAPLTLAFLLLGLVAACDGSAPDAGGGDGPRRGQASASRYSRELVFVGRRRDEPLVASVVSRTTDGQSQRARELRGWLSHGSQWDRFLDERWRGTRAGSPWTLVPHGPLRLTAGRDPEIEALWFREGAREMRLELGRPLGGWNRGSHTRIRIFDGTLRVGAERSRGMVAELLRLQDARTARAAQPDLTHLLLSSGDSAQLVVAVGGDPRTSGSSLAWWRSGGEATEWGQVELSPLAMRPLAEARRDIPSRWRLSIPEGELTGEVQALGLTAEIGEEREGVRAVEVRYTVVGWVERGGRRVRVHGMLRHSRR